MARDFSRKPLRILHVTKWYPNKNDVQNGVFIQKHIACTASFAEVKVLAWLPGTDKTITQESHENGLAVTRTWFKLKTPISAKRHAFRDYIHSHYNNKNLPDVIHLHVFSPDLLLAVYWAKKKNIPVVISEHWSGYMTGVFQKLPYWRKWAYKRLGKVNRILPVSNYLKTNMIAAGIEGTYTVVPNVVEENAAKRDKLNGFAFVMVADLVDDIKNITGVIQAFEKVFESKKTVSMHLIGGGPDEELINEKVAASSAKKAFTLYGRLPNSEVKQLLPQFHALIINSRVESFGVVMLEAHAVGLPVIATRCGGPEEWWEDGDVLIDIDDTAGLTSAMTQLATKKSPVAFLSWKTCLPREIASKLEVIYTEVYEENQIELLKAKSKKKRGNKA